MPIYEKLIFQPVKQCLQSVRLSDEGSFEVLEQVSSPLGEAGCGRGRGSGEMDVEEGSEGDADEA